MYTEEQLNAQYFRKDGVLVPPGIGSINATILVDVQGESIPIFEEDEEGNVILVGEEVGETTQVEKQVLITSPTAVQLLDNGWEAVLKPLHEYVEEKVTSIKTYGSSSAVNQFKIVVEGSAEVLGLETDMELFTWLSKDDRSEIYASLEMLEKMGETEASQTIEELGCIITLPVSEFLDRIRVLWTYARTTQGIEDSKVMEVRKLTDVEEIEAYSVDEGYPEIPTLTISINNIKL